MNLGFTGTRTGLTCHQAAALDRLIRGLPVPASLHHGGCRGADVDAARIVSAATGRRCRIIAHPGPAGDPDQEDSGVDDLRLPARPHLDRNRDIVAACDRLIACPAELLEQVRGGTWATVRTARRAGRPVTLIRPDGVVEGEGRLVTNGGDGEC